MIDQSLSTSGVTIKAAQQGNGSSLEQVVQYSTGVIPMSHSFTTITQGNTIVKNETIGTPDTDYTRYVDVKTDQKRADGKSLDLAPILGVWAKAATKDGNQVFSQAVLGTGLPFGGVAVPIANIPTELRSRLVQELHNDNVYQVKFGEVKKQRTDGRLQYVYDVTIQPVAYAALMKNFSSSVGLHVFDQLDPNQYQGQNPTHMLMTVDVRSGHLVTAELAGTKYKQEYTGYDVPVMASAPKDTITAAELQKRLSKLQ